MARHRLPSRRGLRGLVVAAVAASYAVVAVPSPAVAAGGNASISLTKTVTGATATPTLAVALAVDKTDATPGDDLTYTATVTGSGAQLALDGTFTAASSADVSGTVAAWYDEVEYFAKASKSWVPLGGEQQTTTGWTMAVPSPATSGLALAATPVPADGITYPSSGDLIAGTQIGPHGTASWAYHATLTLTAAQVAVLADGDQAAGIRNVVHYEMTPRDPKNGQPYVSRISFDNPFQSGPMTLTDAAVRVTLPDGTTRVVDSSTVGALAQLAPGDSVPVTVHDTVPVLAARSDTESDSDYLTRLATDDGRVLTASASATATAASGPVTATAAPVSTTEHVPVLTIGKTGPASADAGTTASYDVALTDTGSGAASGLHVDDTVPAGGTGTVTDVPSSLASGEAATAHVSYPIAASQPAGPLTDTAAVTWTDANGNAYGPVSASFSTTVVSSYAGATLSLAPAVAGPDVTGTEQYLTATLLDADGHPLANAPLQFKVTGANTASGTWDTDASGQAVFGYTGTTDGTDTVQAVLDGGGTHLESNTATVSWVTPVAAVSTSTIRGRFFYSNGSGDFGATPSMTPVFEQDFPTIDFNPPAGTIPHNVSGVNVNTRPFTDITTDVGGNYTGAVVATGNGHQAGSGDLFDFYAVFDGSLVVAEPGDVQFDFYSDDGFIFGVGGGATRVSGPMRNPPVGHVTPFDGYAEMGDYNGPTAPVANSIVVHFPAAGVYPYELDYAECCGGELALTMAQHGVGGLPPAGNLSLTPIAPATNLVGRTQQLTVAAMDAGGHPVANAPVTLTVGGANTASIDAVTDTSGIATFSYVGTAAGTDHAQVGGIVNGMPAVSNLVSVRWSTQPTSDGSGGVTGGSGPPPPTVVPGGPADGTVVTAPVPVRAQITPPAGQTITSWKVTYQDLDPAPAVVLASGTGTPPDPLATFDPTVLANDTYAITVSATDSGGGTQTVTTSVVVSGNLKLGRYTTTVRDLTVPIGGQPFHLDRTYDSFDKRVGDFGVGWRLAIAGFRTSANRVLGAGGWTQYNKQCFFGLCVTGFHTSTPHYVNVTFPDGHTESFDFTPDGGSNLFWFGTAKFTARPGTTSTLEVVGDTEVDYFDDGNLYDSSRDLYNPTRFKLTTRDGRVYVLDTVAGLVSETDPNGTTVTVDSTGIHASSGPSLTLTRDSSGRVSKATGIAGQTVDYGYDASGDLVSATDSDGQSAAYTYDSSHDLQTIAGTGGVIERAVTYTSDGRVATVTDAGGNTVAVSNDVGARQQTFTDNTGDLTTVLTMDELGDVVRQDLVADGSTRTTTFTYDALGHRLSRTDPLGHTTSATYDANGDLLTQTDALGHTTTFTYNAYGEPLTVTDSGGATTTYTYDTHGLRATKTDAVGRVTTYSYDGAGRLVGETDPAGGVSSFAYDASGNLLSRTDPMGRVTSYTYDAQNRVATKTDPAGGVTAYSYDAAGDLTGLQDPSGGSWGYTYDPLGHTLTRTDPLGRVTTWTYDAVGDVVASKDPLGHDTTWQRDADGRVTSTTDATGAVTKHGYDGFGDVVTATDALGHVTSYGHDDGGDLVSRTMPDGGVWKYGYDALGRRTTVTDPLGGVTSTDYSGTGRVTARADAAGHRSTYGYDAAGQLTAFTDPLGHVTHYGYDALGDRASVTDPLGNVTVTAYDGDREPVSVTDPTGVVTAAGYDADGRVSSVTDGAGRTVTAGYDADGDRISQTGPTGAIWSATYDAAGQVTSATDPLGHTTTYAYDDAGRRISTTDPLGGTTKTGYDSDGRAVLLTDALGGTVQVERDAAGDVTGIVDPIGARTTLAYDVMGDLVKEVDPSGRTLTTTYDELGRVTQTVNGRGQATTYGYTADGRLDSAAAPDVTATYTWDGDGRLTGYSDPTGATSAAYDAAGRLTSVTSPAGNVGYGYDAAGRRTSMTVAGNTIDYAYDATGQLASITDGTASVGYTWDPAGRLGSVARANGVSTTYGYDAGDELTSVTDSGGAVSRQTTYGYDADGRRTSATTSSGTESYAFDALGRVTNVTYAGGDQATYSYDAAGNRLSMTVGGQTTTYAYDSSGRLTSTTGPSGTTSYGYDADDEVTSRGSDTFGYDSAGRLTAATVGGASASYAYDGAGLHTATTTGGTTSTLLYDVVGDAPLVVSDGSAVSVWGPGGTALETSAAGADYPLTDALGSVTALTDAAGTVGGTASYDAFGAVRASTGSVGPVGFAGERTDPVAGLVDLRARWYDPATGRFTTADSLLQSAPGTAGFNRWSYAGNDPVDFVDPTGHEELVEEAETLSVDAALEGIAEETGEALVEDFETVLEDLENPCEEADCLPDGGPGDPAPGDPAPPGDEPPGSQPPGDQPPGDQPPGDEPPGDQPPGNEPPIKPGSSGGDTAGKPFSQSVRQQALDENPDTCVYCRMKTDSPQVDHSIPRARGGNATLDNAQTACGWCNASKGARDFPVNPPPNYEGGWPPPWWSAVKP